MAASVQIAYRPMVAQAATGQVHLALQKPKDPIAFTREALGQWLVGTCYSAEIAAMAAKLRGPDDHTIGTALDAAHDAYADDGTPSADMVTGVPPRIAVSWCYLATARIVERIAKAARKLPPGSPADVSHGDGGIIPEPGGTLPIPGLPFPVPGTTPTTTIPWPGLPPLPFPVPTLGGTPPIVIPGAPLFDTGAGTSMSAVPVGVIALIGVAFAIAAAAYVAKEALTTSEVETTKRREVEVAAQVKVTSEVCAANAAIGEPCDVPDVVRSLAKEEHNEHMLLKYGIPLAGLAVGAGAVYYGGRKLGAW